MCRSDSLREQPEEVRTQGGGHANNRKNEKKEVKATLDAALNKL